MWLLTASSESIRSAVSGGLLITLYTVWRHAIRYYVREPTNIHHGGHHTAIVTTLHNRVPFKTALSPNYPGEHGARSADAWRGGTGKRGNGHRRGRPPRGRPEG